MKKYNKEDDYKSGVVPLSLVMSDGRFPLLSGEGVVYSFRHSDTDYRNFYLWAVDYIDREPIYVFSEYPEADVLAGIADLYRDEVWFDYDEVMEVVNRGYDIDKVRIFYENNYKLPYQNVTLEHGRIFAHDEEDGSERELVRVHIRLPEIKIGISFHMFTKTRLWTKPMITNLLNNYDSKVPLGMINRLKDIRSKIMGGYDYEFEVEDIYVLNGLAV